MKEPLETLVQRARDGDADALEAVAGAISNDVYNLAVRMLWRPEDAEDATQEILLKVVTHLGTFRGESAFTTWVFRVAANHLLNIRKSRAEREDLAFERFGTDLATGLADVPASPASDPDGALLEEEVKIGCTQGMLLCLDRADRLAYVLGDVFALRSEDAAAVLEITPATFRKRLSRARSRLRDFMRGHCGLLNSAVACRCDRRVAHAVASGRVDPKHLQFAGQGGGWQARLSILQEVDAVEDLHRVAEIFQSHPRYEHRDRLVADVRLLLHSGRYPLLDPGD